MELNGWIKLHRKFIGWEWYKKSEMVHLFLHLLLKANHDTRKWQGVVINRGQLITGRKSLSDETGISERVIRTCLERLKSTNEIAIKSTNKNSIITICNYDSYQIIKDNNDHQIDQQIDQQSTSNRPAIDQQPTTNKNDKKNKNDKNEKNHLFKNSKYFDFELFKSEIGENYQQYDLKFYYDSLKNYSESKNKMYMNWLAAGRNFILKDLRENKAKFALKPQGKIMPW
jgi:hypothetical protein